MVSWRRFFALVGALALGSVACETRPHNPAAAAAGSAAQTVMIQPLNVTATLPTELEARSDFLWPLLESYLKEHGKHVQTIRLASARRLWMQSIKTIQTGEGEGGRGFDAAAQLFVLQIAEHADFDALIAPNLFVQQARMSGKSASWDRVKRKIEIDGDIRSIGSIVTTTSLAGAIPAASLHVVILDAHGRKLMEAQAGLELLARISVEADTDDTMSETRWGFQLRPDLFANEQQLREGISKALDPFLPPLPDTSE